jgi:hypothetical protein
MVCSPQMAQALPAMATNMVLACEDMPVPDVITMLF